MLGNFEVLATIAVSDISAAKKFYGETLGLKQVSENPAGVIYESGGSNIFVYSSANAGTNKATCASWEVQDIESVAAELKEAGIVFEHYDMPGGTREGDVHIMEGEKAVWFKDPDGNILALGSSV